ncbi:hypothetical protein CVU75_02170 [Candidatus Dependentiae bacterium HGW-Dependentiae-1]|nr:MAG: hypothetical protein CVU75_02170 [Candidatus Dependentiae bacterium HGW-Dependentiae-1]
MYQYFLVALLSMGLSFLSVNADCCCCHDSLCAMQGQEAENESARVLLEDDPFGEPEVDDITKVPLAPKEVIEVPQASPSQALLQRLGCTVIAGYIMCRNCASSAWRKLKSLY